MPPSREHDTVAPVRRRESPPAVARVGGGLPGRALAMQHGVGNRATAKLLARWTRHPDPEQKGVMVPDSSAAELARANPPQNA